VADGKGTRSEKLAHVEKIVRLIDERGDTADSWVAICDNGEEAALARYYSAPGRVERELPDLVLTGERRRPAPPMNVACPVEVRCCGEG
jgi:hypothetical protein